MTTLTVNLTNICTGGNHLTFNLSGFKSQQAVVNLDDLTEPLSEADAQTFIRVIARMAKNGRTQNQARTLLQTGVTVIV